MTGAPSSTSTSLRDESMHCNFGIDLINQIKLENPHLWTPAFKAEIKGLVPEGRRARVPLRRGHHAARRARHERADVQGLPALHRQPARHADRPDALFPNEENPFPWMSEMIDLKKERNFFRDPRDRVPVGWSAVLGIERIPRLQPLRSVREIKNR